MVQVYFFLLEERYNYPLKDRYGELDRLIEEIKEFYSIKGKFKTELYPDKIRKVEILGLPFLFFFKESSLFVKINIPQYNWYIYQLKQAGKTKEIYEGFQRIHLKKLNKWQIVELKNIDYYGKKLKLVAIIFY